MLKVWSFPSKSVLDLSRNSKQMWSSLHWWPQILDCSILFNVCYSQYQIPPPATIFSLKYSPISHLLYYIIIPRHSDLIVSTVNIPAPQPIISGIVMAWPATHFLPIHILTLSIISHSTVSHNRYHTGIIKYSLIKLINTVLHETHWLHGTTPDHCTTGHFPIQLTHTNAVVGHPFGSYYSSSMVYHPDSDLSPPCSNRMIYNTLSLNHHILLSPMIAHCTHTL